MCVCVRACVCVDVCVFVSVLVCVFVCVCRKVERKVFEICILSGAITAIFTDLLYIWN